jgi:hypothetical protein
MRTRCVGLGRRQPWPINRKAARCPEFKDKIVQHKHYIDEHGEDLPEIRNWKWSQDGTYKEKSLSVEEK